MMIERGKEAKEWKNDVAKKREREKLISDS